MRTLKFRAFDKECKEICYYFTLEGALRYDEEEKINPDDFEFSQWTGFKDKNGNDIYEWDIIQFDDGDVPCDVLALVEFKDGAFLNCQEYSLGGDIMARPVVVGNIYENPELEYSEW
jgi:uncharacterized phage protein (TIGR01671 family)